MIGAAFVLFTFMTRGTAALHPPRSATPRAAPLDPRFLYQGAGIIGARGPCGAASTTGLPAG